MTSALPLAAALVTLAAGGYSGHGSETLSPEVIARYRAPPLEQAVSARVQSMLDVRAPSSGLLSPDGKRLFFTWNVTGVRQVWRIDRPMGFPIQLTGGEDVTALFDVTPDGTTLVLTRDRKGEEYPGIYLQSVEGGPLRLVQHKPKVRSLPERLSADGKFLYFRANDVKPDAYALYRYGFATGQVEKVFDQDGLWSLADLADGNRALLAKQVGANMTEYFELDLATRALTPLFGQGEREDYVALYGAAGQVLVLTPKLGEFRRLYRFDRADKKLVPVTPELSWDVARFEVDAGRTRVLLSVNEGGYTRVKAYDARTLKEQRLPGLPRADHVLWGMTTRNARWTTLMLDTGTAPRTSHVLDWRTGKLTAWHVPSAPEVDLARFVPVRLESYPARDGTPIPMFVRRPAACQNAPAPCPLIVSFHGGPEGQSVAGFSPVLQLYVDAGFTVVEPNVRGSDGYGKGWLHADDGPKRLSVITDIEDAAKHLRSAWAKGGVAPKIGIMGGSYGGYSSLMGMTYFAGAYDAGVEIVGISNLVTFLENTAPYRRALRISEYGDPVKDRAALVQLSPLTHVAKASGPMLLIQGATDPRVPVGEAIQVYEAFQKKGHPAQLIVFPDEGHGVAKRENAVLLHGHALRFFEHHLLPPRQAER